MTEPVVTLRDGKLRGSYGEDRDGGKFCSFKGIPYGKPPVGELRFKTPQPAESWTGIRDATNEGDACKQLDSFLKKGVIGSDDCLFLNVFTKLKVGGNLKPVMVSVHCGGFVMGSKNTDLYGPEFLMTQDIVLVTINYRVGILGFLSFEDTSVDVDANAGLKDIVLSLKWVQSNIAKFGGDPGNVTIFGTSGGAGAVHCLVLSPLCRGLIHKAIIQSGCALNPWALGKHFTVDTFQNCGIEETDPKRLVKKLKQLPIDELFEVQTKIVDTFDPSFKRYFAPVVEGGPEDSVIFSMDPFDVIKSGNYNQIPLIFGYTADEGMLIHLMKANTKSTFFQGTEFAIPHNFNFKKETKEGSLMVDKINKFYFDGMDVSEASINNIYELATDTIFLHGIMESVKNHAATSPAPVYLYKMTVETALNFVATKVLNVNKAGACHADDLGYLFKNIHTPEIVSDSAEDLAIKRFVKLWTNFAYYGNPTPSNNNDQILKVNWKPVAKNSVNFLDIGQALRPDIDPELMRMLLWDELSNLNGNGLS